MKQKFIKSFVVRSFLSDMTIVSFSYKKRNYLLTCSYRIRIDSDKTSCDFVVRVHGVNPSMGTIDFLFCIENRDYVYDNDVKNLVSNVCSHLDDDLPF